MSIYDNLIANAENQYGIPTGLLSSVIGNESTFNPNAYNPDTGAAGLAGIEPATAANPGYGIAPISNVYDPSQAISFGAQYLQAMYHKAGSWTGAVVDYGDVPSTGPVTAGQQNVVNVATSADISGYTPAQIRALPQVGFLTQAYDWLTGQPSGTTIQSQATDVGLRIGTAVLAMIFIATGLAAIAFGSVSRGATRIIQKLPVVPVG